MSSSPHFVQVGQKNRSGQIPHYLHQGIFHFPGDEPKLRDIEQFQKPGRLDGGNGDLAVVFKNCDSAGQRRGDVYIFFEDLFGLLGIADFKDSTFPSKVDPCVIQLLPQIIRILKGQIYVWSRPRQKQPLSDPSSWCCQP
jgi:hypothetical protein